MVHSQKMQRFKVDYSAAARRHFKDADLLNANGRSVNAGYLYGYVAECGLKALLVWHGYPTDAEGSVGRNAPNFKLHVDALVDATTFPGVQLYLNGRSGAQYLAMIPSISDFSDWRVDHRYYRDSEVPASLAKWKAAAEEMARMLDYAKTCGLPS